MQTKHTPGPWRWVFNREHKSMHLVGGRPQYDLTIMDFTRWGMGGAVPLLRDLAHDGMNIMHRVCDRPDWIAPFEGRSHHANWCASITHADMVLISAAPDLLGEIEREYIELSDFNNNWPGRHTADGQIKLCRLRDLICAATGRGAEDVQDDYGTRLHRKINGVES